MVNKWTHGLRKMVLAKGRKGGVGKGHFFTWFFFKINNIENIGRGLTLNKRGLRVRFLDE